MRDKLLFIFSFILFLAALSSCNSPENKNEVRHLTFQLDGKEYDKLYLKCRRFSSMGVTLRKPIFIEGKEIENNKWLFEIPDSINQQIRYFELKKSMTDYDADVETFVEFLFKEGKKEYMNSLLFYDDRLHSIKARYQKNHLDTLPLFVGVDEDRTIIYSTDYFSVELNDIKDTEMEVALRSKNFGVNNWDGYEVSLGNTKSQIEKYPYSKYLLRDVAFSRKQYKREDLKDVLDLFTEEVKKSEYGKEIVDYIHFNPDDFAFTNVKLRNSLTDEAEFIVLNKEKYNLIVFSAYWCGPCHRLIPVIKEIYNDTKDYLDITYISLDDPEDKPKWVDILKTHSVPWRSLSLSDDGFSLKNEYQINSVPYAVLINPQGKGKVINIWSEKEELYKLADNKVSH
ncbi:thioredoxin family protein [Prevotella sp. 10(H)]|uniref:TlpA family protein disulfide reductase n=1 Tax=Prevotella sp. 10(H) TaxID=1158294 RepID=UPI0004A7511B|nr:thioredoxin family protein [Prevotella sp. 10(H)]